MGLGPLGFGDTVWGVCLNAPVCPLALSRTLGPSVLTGQDTAAGPDSGCSGRGAPAPAPGEHLTLRVWGLLQLARLQAEQRLAVSSYSLPTERPGGLGDHLAAAGPAGAVAGCGWSCAPSHGGLSRPAGHLCLRQDLGAEAASKRLRDTCAHPHRQEWEGQLPSSTQENSWVVAGGTP